MNKEELNIISAAIAERTGLAVRSSHSVEKSGPVLELMPVGINPIHAFSIVIQLGWKSVLAVFKPGSYAKDLLASMEQASNVNRKAFVMAADRLKEKGAQVTVRINDNASDLSEQAVWIQGWQQVVIQVKRSPIEVKAPDTYIEWGVNLLGLVMHLLPLEESESEEDLSAVGLPEGAKMRIEVNKYERSRINRAAALSAHGTSCKVCSFNFEENYGPEGKGFVHVHHVIPVSQIGENYLIDPVLDLIPVCPNCHAIIHLTNPPRTVDEVRNMLRCRKT
jgi:5-methylcytosine-specific restriction protein A